MPRFEDAPRYGIRSEAFTSSESGVWARPRADSGRPQDRPLHVPFSPWFSWCLALALFVAVGASVLGTLLELASELVELGHQRSISDSRTR
jgi:hypothetical protein